MMYYYVKKYMEFRRRLKKTRYANGLIDMTEEIGFIQRMIIEDYHNDYLKEEDYIKLYYKFKKIINEIKDEITSQILE